MTPGIKRFAFASRFPVCKWPSVRFAIQLTNKIEELVAVTMSWITIVWSMNAAACLTLAGILLRGLVQAARELGRICCFHLALSRRRPSPHSS